MIASLNGLLIHKSPDHVVMDVGGVGYRASISAQTFAKLPPEGEKLFLFIYTAVREDDITLYGFREESERRIFQKLISVNGIGPKLALTILSGIQPQELIEALHREDLVRLTAIQGIGKKTAERMILDLKDKMIGLLEGSSVRPVPLNEKRKLYEEALSGLMNLGYSRSTAEQTLNQIPMSEGGSVESIIRDALKRVSK